MHSDELRPREAYTSPQLTRYGQVQDLTESTKTQGSVDRVGVNYYASH